MKSKAKATIIITFVFSLSVFFIGCGEEEALPAASNNESVINSEDSSDDNTGETAEIANSTFQWPRSEIASLLPIPKSNIGSISWEASYGFVIYVGETPKADYDDYVNACADNGFTVDYRKGDDFYYANNDAGYHLSLNYEGNNTMFIRIDEPDDIEGDNTKPSETLQPKQDDTSVASNDDGTQVEGNSEEPASVFSPQDVSDATIKSIKTYSDYLVMYQKIVEDYLANYEAAVKGTILYSEETFAEMKKQYNDAFESQKKIYGSMGNAPLVGKDDLVDYLITYRDSLKEYTDSLAETLKAFP